MGLTFSSVLPGEVGSADGVPAEGVSAPGFSVVGISGPCVSVEGDSVVWSSPPVGVVSVVPGFGFSSTLSSGFVVF